jgi:hypothetical protein
MTRLEKCEILKSAGYTYNDETGKVFGVFGKEIKGKHIEGYIKINFKEPYFNLLGHHFAWYMTYGNVDFDELDHINRIKDDNKISNLRIVTSQQNKFNRNNTKGFYWHKKANKWQSQIRLNNKNKYLGLFNTEEEAENAYLQAKEIYHIMP